MSIVGFFIILIVLCVLAWGVQNFLPIDARIKQGILMLIGLFVFIAILIFLLQLLGINTGINYRMN